MNFRRPLLIRFLVGRVLDRYRDVQVFDSGLLFFRSYGRHHSSDGYYLGQKWQCVEFIKRFYFEARRHRVPEVMGHARDYFDPLVVHRGMNTRRGMVQFVNGGDEPPMAQVCLEASRSGLSDQLTAVSRLTPFFQQNTLAEQATFLDLLKLLGYVQLTVSDGDKFAHQITIQ